MLTPEQHMMLEAIYNPQCLQLGAEILRVAESYESRDLPALYCATLADEGVIKIGVSLNPRRRTLQLKRTFRHRFKDASKLTLARVWLPPKGICSYTLESTLKTIMREHRIFGEWFNSDIESVDQQISNMDYTL